MKEFNANKEDWTNWVKTIKTYSKPNAAKSWWQITNSFVPYIGLWIAMVYSLEISYWLTLALSILAAGFLVRIFIIFHDCGHGSYFKSAKLKRVVGIIAGMLSFTPYHKWHYMHKTHHKTVGNLDKRGMGDVMTMTVEEYKNASDSKKRFYRLYRNPIILFFIAPFFLFSLINRFPSKDLPKKVNTYTHLTTLAIVILITALSFWIGFKTFVLIQVPVLYFASSFGVWLFYIQHQFKDVVWERGDKWDYKTVAMTGSSYAKFPRIIQWFSGHIGFHHIHPLGPKIPNYNLEKCLKENPIFQKKPLTFLGSIKSMKYRLWDEKQHKLVSFKEALQTT